MKTGQLERLFDTACNIIISLEDYADESLKKDINDFFNEILASDETTINHSADDEAQDWEKFGKNKI